MITQKPRPAFQSLELDPIDARLEARAAEKGIPTLVNPRPDPVEAPEAAPASARPSAPRKPKRGGDSEEGTPRSRMMSLNIEVPDYVWIALKTRAARILIFTRFSHPDMLPPDDKSDLQRSASTPGTASSAPTTCW